MEHLDYFFQVLKDESMIFPIFLSARVLLLTVLLHIIFGVMLGYILSKKFPLRDLLESLVVLPLVFPPVALGFFLLILFGREGFIGGWLGHIFGIEVIFSFWGITIAAFVAGLPLIVKPVQSAIESSAGQLIEASYVLGKSEFQTFFRVVLPSIKKSVIAGLTLAFGRSLGEIGMTLMLGGNIYGKTTTISLAIYNAVFDGEFNKAIILSIFLGAISLSIFYVLRKMSAI